MSKQLEITVRAMYEEQLAKLQQEQAFFDVVKKVLESQEGKQLGKRTLDMLPTTVGRNGRWALDKFGDDIIGWTSLVYYYWTQDHQCQQFKFQAAKGVTNLRVSMEYILKETPYYFEGRKDTIKRLQDSLDDKYLFAAILNGIISAQEYFQNIKGIYNNFESCIYPLGSAQRAELRKQCGIPENFRPF